MRYDEMSGGEGEVGGVRRERKEIIKSHTVVDSLIV